VRCRGIENRVADSASIEVNRRARRIQTDRLDAENRGCAPATSRCASDAVNDVQPSGVQGINRPIHQVTQVNLGLPIVDNAYLEDAATEAERLKRWEFMFTLHIFQIPGGTASPFNALATF
jgi:hypothetical protein